MKCTKKTSIIGLAVLVITIICCVLLYSLYSAAKTNCINGLNASFISSIYLEKDERIKDLNIPYAFVFIPDETVNNGTVVRKTDSFTSVEKDTISNVLSDTDKLNLIHQTYLFDKKAVNVFHLDSLLQMELMKVPLSFKTGVKYVNNITKETLFSHTDPHFYQSSYSTEPLTIGLRNEITLQAFADISPFTIIGKAHTQFVTVGITWFFLTLLLLLSVSKEESEEIHTHTWHKIANNIYWDSDNSLVRYNKKEIPLNNQSAQLMELFLSSPDRFVSHEVLVLTLYGNIGDPKDRISQTIKRLRRLLISVNELEVRSIPYKGYQLIVNGIS